MAQRDENPQVKQEKDCIILMYDKHPYMTYVYVWKVHKITESGDAFGCMLERGWIGVYLGYISKNVSLRANISK